MLISADKNKFSPPEHRVFENVKSDIPLVLITRLDNFEFNDQLLGLKEYVLCDYCEYEWDKSDFKDTHVFGKNTDDFAYRFPGEEWIKFDNWVKENPPKLYIKRELLAKDATDWLASSTYPCYNSPFQIQTKEEFNARPIELFHYFGRSHEARIWFQSNAYKEHGVTLVDNLYYLQGYLNEGIHKHLWVSVNIPHFARLPLEQLLAFNNLSKLSLSMPGCGKTCFRHSEAPINSVMVMEDSGISFPFPWIHGENCIMYKGDDTIPAIKEALQRDDLYDIYLRGIENIDKYRISNYNLYLENLIKAAL